MATLADALVALLSGLDRLEISYYVGGSVASTFYGIYRTTNDVDLVANIAPERADELAECIGKEFYIDAATVRSAIAVGRAFNVVHLASACKIDIFPAKRDAYSQAAFARRAFRELRSLGPEPIECAVATAEDTIYRAGGETSERQWNDLRGIRMVSGAILDYDYLRKWAPYLKVDDLLEQLLAE